MPSNVIKNAIQSTLSRAGVTIVKRARLDRLLLSEQAARDIEFLRHFPAEHAHKLIDLFPRAKGKLRQDLFALSTVNFKRGGFFVDFGATDGIGINNSWILEKDFGWNGIVAEPARVWQHQLKVNRSCKVEFDCVWTETGTELEFAEADWAEISTISNFTASDHHEKARKARKSYKVRTISLNDMLAKHDAPPVIDYLSIDTEGSEFDILSSLNFNKYRFRAISCEHNFTSNREKIHELLSANGYCRVFENLSEYDDWYVGH